MAKLDKKKLQKLSPEQRLKKLREIEEAGKKELKEAETLIEQTLAEIKEAPADSGPGPAPATDISQLFGASDNLEGAVQSESKAEEGGEVKYSAVTYSTDYKALDIRPPESAGKTEDTVKYEGASDQAMKSTATKTDVEASKKYSRG